jgi:hypothetical protein
MTPRLQTHHIEYEEPKQECLDDDECLTCGHIRRQEWTVTLPWFMHKPMNIIQRWKPTHERYALLINWVHAIMHEANRMRRQLDQMEE